MDSNLIAEVSFDFSKDEIVDVLQETYRKRSKVSRIIQCFVLALMFITFLVSFIMDKTKNITFVMISIGSLGSLIISIIIPKYRFGKIARDMVLKNQNNLRCQFYKNKWVFGSQNIIEFYPDKDKLICMENKIVCIKEENTFLIPKRAIDQELWNKLILKCKVREE